MSDHTILVWLKGPQSRRAAIPVASVLGRLSGATLHLVHVGAPERSKAELLRLLDLSSGNLAAANAVLEQRCGDLAQELATEAWEHHSRYIVLARHDLASNGNGADRWPALVEILKKAPCPVVVVPGAEVEPTWELSHLLVPHDGTPTTAAAIGPSAELAKQAGGELVVLHVAKGEPDSGLERGALRTPRYLDQPHHEWPAWSSEFLERLGCLGCMPETVGLRLVLAPGDPATEILRLAGTLQSNLIVLAWRGRSELSRARTLQAVVGAANCAVMIFRVTKRPGRS